MLVGKLVLATIKSQLYLPRVPKWVTFRDKYGWRKIEKEKISYKQWYKKGSGFYLKNTIYCSYLHTATYTNHTWKNAPNFRQNYQTYIINPRALENCCNSKLFALFTTSFYLTLNFRFSKQSITIPCSSSTL